MVSHPLRLFYWIYDMLGWISLHRKLTNWEWYKDSKMVHLFVHLLLLANHEPHKWQGINIDRGQVVTGLNSLNEATGISIQSLRTCLSKLEKTGEITNKSTNRFRLITLCNYSTYQDRKTPPNKPANNQPTSQQQATNNQSTANNNDNNGNNANNVNIYTLQQCENEFFKQGLTDKDAREFFIHYDSQGWLKGNGLPITGLASQITKWRLNPKQNKPTETDAKEIVRKAMQYAEESRNRREGNGTLAKIIPGGVGTTGEGVF